ncbi:MAG TPA: M48 family metalloprotease [Candidatus Binatia bacterium]|nr:M48 family metalloprotease [Candidatus Binatia bacterium]
MKRFLLLILLLFAEGCSAQGKLYWRAKDFVLDRSPAVGLRGRNEQIVWTIPIRTVQEMTLAHLRINRAAKIQSDLYIVEGDEPNAFATFVNGQRVIGINLGMVKIIDGEINEYAALIGHEAAHWAKGHVDAGETRASTLNALGTLVGVGLSAAGVPAAGLISGLGIDLIESSYSRDQEREADAQSIDYLLVANYDPRAAIRLHEKFLKIDRRLRLPFLSSHPSNEERIQNLRALIDAKKSEQP